MRIGCAAALALIACGRPALADMFSDMEQRPVFLTPGCPAPITGAVSSKADVARLYETAKTLKRGEYETSEAYSARVAAAIALQPIILAAPLSPTAGTYDADRGVLALKSADVTEALGFVLQEGPDSRHTAFSTVELVQKRSKESRYRAQNAFGAKAIVRHSDVDITEIGFPSINGLVEVDYGRDILMPKAWSVEIPIPPDQARAVRSRLDFVVQGALHEPFFVEDKGYVAAEAGRPNEGEVSDHAAIIEPTCEGFRDRASGKILAYFILPSGSQMLQVKQAPAP